MTRCGNSEMAAWWDGLFLSKGEFPGQALAAPQPSPSPASPLVSVLQCGGLAAITANTWLRDDDAIGSKQEPVLGTLREKKSCSSTGNRSQSRAFPRLKTKPTLSSCPHQTHPLQAAAHLKSGALSCGPVWKRTVPPGPLPTTHQLQQLTHRTRPPDLAAELGGERVTNLLFFFLYFHYHQIWDECYFCKTQHKKKFTMKRLVSLRCSILPHHPSKRPS